MVRRWSTTTEPAHKHIQDNCYSIHGYILSIQAFHTPSPPSRRPGRSLAHAAPHAPAVHHAVVWEHANRTSTKPLVADGTMPVLVNHHSSVQSTRHLASVLVHLVVVSK